MCGSASVSFGTFAVAAVCMAYVGARPGATVDQRWLACVAMSFTAVQLVDGVLWLTVAHQCPRVNYAVARYVLPCVLLAEVWVSYACARRFAGWRPPVYEPCLLLYTVVTLAVWIRGCRSPARPGPEGYLWWCGGPDRRAGDLHGAVNKIAFFALLMVPVFVAFPEGTLRGLIISTAILTFLYAYGRPDFGARWCWSANTLAVLAALTVTFPVAV